MDKDNYPRVKHSWDIKPEGLYLFRSENILNSGKEIINHYNKPNIEQLTGYKNLEAMLQVSDVAYIPKDLIDPKWVYEQISENDSDIKALWKARGFPMHQGKMMEEYTNCVLTIIELLRERLNTLMTSKWSDRQPLTESEI